MNKTAIELILQNKAYQAELAITGQPQVVTINSR